MDNPIRPRDPDEVVGVQVVPVDASNPLSIEPQFAGPDEHTTGWSIYTRHPDGTVSWVVDAPNETTAMVLGTTVAQQHNVAIEPQPWKDKHV